MLVLTRRLDESIMIGDGIEIRVLKIAGTQVHLGIEAPRHVTLHRKEIYERVVAENQRAIQATAMPQVIPPALGKLKQLIRTGAQASASAPEVRPATP